MNINKDAVYDLYVCCLNARGAYNVLKLVGADQYLPGLNNCIENLEKAIKKAESV